MLFVYFTLNIIFFGILEVGFLKFIILDFMTPSAIVIVTLIPRIFRKLLSRATFPSHSHLYLYILT